MASRAVEGSVGALPPRQLQDTLHKAIVRNVQDAEKMHSAARVGGASDLALSRAFTGKDDLRVGPLHARGEGGHLPSRGRCSKDYNRALRGDV